MERLNKEATHAHRGGGPSLAEAIAAKGPAPDQAAHQVDVTHFEVGPAGVTQLKQDLGVWQRIPPWERQAQPGFELRAGLSRLALRREAN
ncbi:MAG TPA: hypothetical protein PL117_05390 [Accumulibacter sp.]|uniref:hypothetical protein n=1 Tax=Accumulibacter sp. TaxID=2053492 RepID=UPI002CF575E7|nr:hypothetical protein [Accumulibacter sp.]HRF72189.1 hypothetical protein [Accumulibacter sp.]